ncbi:MAG: hypothetical protein JNM56_27210 [Planctomycetia bacterium]|nr:hypothetical protein [Planctomycetia bacterium]
MLGRPATTILYIGPHQIARADFTSGGSPKLLGLWQTTRPEGNDLTALAETALILGPKVGRNVWVLCSDFWTQTVKMAARAVATMSEADLTQALGFEVEPLSGVNAFESVLAQTLVGTEADGKNFWITQALLVERDALEELIRKAGGKFAGMAHPGGLPRPFEVGGDGTWQRVELWPDAILCLHGQTGKGTELHLIKADARQQRWHSEEEAWREKYGVADRRELLQLTGEILTFDRDGQPRVQDDPQQTLGVLLTGWAGFLGRKPTGVPLIRPTVKPLSSTARLGIAAALMLAVMGLAFGQHTLAQAQLKSIQAETAQLRQPETLLPALDKQVADRNKTKADLTEKLVARKRTTEALAIQRLRLAKLLAAVSKLQPDDLIIQRIEGETGSPVLHGICLEPKQANQLTIQLERALSPEWRVEPAVLKAMQLVPEGGPYTFQVNVHLVSNEPPPKVAAVPPES